MRQDAFRVGKPLSMSFPDEINFQSNSSRVLMHILSGYQVCDCGIQYHLCSTYGRSSMRVVGRPAVSGRALTAQAKCPGFDSWWLCCVYQKESTFVNYSMPVLSEDLISRLDLSWPLPPSAIGICCCWSLKVVYTSWHFTQAGYTPRYLVWPCSVQG